MPLIQDIIYKFEEGGGNRVFRIALAVLVVLALGIGYNVRAYRNFNNQEAMDVAQVARNLAEGQGYSTLFIRPFDFYLLKSHNAADQPDPLRVRGPHPDLANAPVYSTILAGLLKIVRPEYDLSKAKGLWKTSYQAEVWIAIFNQVLFLGVVLLTFWVASRLFDRSVAWFASVLLLGSELLWRFSISGLSTLLLMLVFLALLGLLLRTDELSRDPNTKPSRLLLMAAGAGLLTGIGALTRYSFGWVIIPVVVFLAFLGGARNSRAAVLAFTAFALTMAPWVARNYHVSGTPFGTAGYAVLQQTFVFPGDELEHSMQPNLLQRVRTTALAEKFGEYARKLIREDLPALGGSWLTAFFAVGLMVSFRNPTTQRLRWLVLGCLGVLAVAQVMGRTHISTQSPIVNGENLLVLLVPMVIVYGVALFYLLLDQLALPAIEMQRAVKLLFGLLACLPLIQVFLPPPPEKETFPPYHAPSIQRFARPFTAGELTMSDVPWAVAWYGRKQCAGLTLEVEPSQRDRREDFAELSKQCGKPVNGLLLTPVTLGKSFRELRKAGSGWGGLVMLYGLKKQVPKEFPLACDPAETQFPDLLMLADSLTRWPSTPAGATASGEAAR